jgi:signal transduction histidine kinase/ligand-binding sensor domain-containing protein/DNA-binding response OmpR family regulator
MNPPRENYQFSCLLLICLFCSFFSPNAQTPVTYLGINQGLSNNSVRCILKDHKGFMWFGTFDGLNRYDGYGFRVFRNKINDSSSLINPFINVLNEDKKGNLWIGTRHGLSIYNSLTDKFTHLTHSVNKSVSLVSDVIKAIGTDSSNNVFVGAENIGLLFCRNGNTVAQSIALNNGDMLVTSFGVQAIKISPEKKLWVFVQNKGLCLLDYKSMTLRLVNSTVQSASCLEIDGKTIWMGTPNGLYEYNMVSNICNKVQNDMLPDRMVALNLDEDHNLWIGTSGNGIVTWNQVTGKIEYLEAGDSKYSLLSGDIYTIYEDKESRKWIGTQKGGVNIIDPQKKKFQIVAHDAGIRDSFKGNSVSAFYEAPDSKLWIATDDAGINIWNRKKNTFVNMQHRPGDERSLPSNHVTAIKSDAENNLWIATFTSGLLRLNQSQSLVKRYKCINPVSGLENPVVYVLYEDNKKTLWATTLRQGNQYGALYYYNRSADRFDAFDTGLSDLFTLNEDRQGNLWGGNLNQLVKIDRLTKRHQFYSVGHSVRAVYEDNKANLWVGTEGGGLILFDRKQNKIIERYTSEQGLCNNAILNILEDKTGNFWISTLNGLSRFDPIAKTFRNYYYNDGLQSNQFNYNAALSLTSGQFVFGGIKGFNLFRPEQIFVINTALPVALTGIKVNNKSIYADNSFVVKTNENNITQLKIPYDEAVLSFEFAALEYSVPEKISYAYYLQGWDRDWNYSGNLRIASYTHLSEGTYTFHVKTTNAEGEWGKQEVSMQIIILPPWYRSWWAYLLYAIITASVAYIFWLYRSRQTRLKYEIALANVNTEKEKIEKERQQAEYEKEKAVHEAERIINEKEKELNTKRLDFFTNIAHEFRTPLTLIINPIKDLLQKKPASTEKNNELSIVYRNARRLLSLVDQLLFFRKADIGIDKIKPARLNFYSLCYEVYLCFVQQAKARNIHYQFECDNQQLEMYVDREKMEIVLYNLLSNAIKYTPDDGSIIFKITEKPEEVEVTIADTGSGIPSEAGDKLFDKFYKAGGKGVQTKPGFGIGLYLVKQFIEAHVGKVSYTSTLGKGTIFCLQLKKGKTHFDPVIISDEKIATPVFLDELQENNEPLLGNENDVVKKDKLQPVVTEKQVMLVVDDDVEIRRYISNMFKDQFTIYEAGSGIQGLETAENNVPDIIISDIKMEDGDGIDFCKKIKTHASLSHIPVILLTGTHSSELKLEGVEGGADDYITKPFDKELLMARVANLQKSRASLQKYFFNEITLNKQDQKISEEYKQFLEKCIAIVEAHLEDDDFSVAKLAVEMGQSYSSVYKKIRMISGQSLKGFVRFIRLRKAAELLINTNYNVSEVAFQVGIYDAKFFREQFNKLFGMNPSEYIKKYRKPFQGQYSINPNSNQ